MVSSFRVASLRTRLNRWQRAWGRYASLIHQADMPSVARVVTAPAGRGHATRLACFMRPKPAQAGFELRLSPCPAAPPAADSGASN